MQADLSRPEYRRLFEEILEKVEKPSATSRGVEFAGQGPWRDPREDGPGLPRRL